MRGNGVQVLIVGAGIAGLAAARTLREWGASVQIVERAAQPQTQGAGIYLPGNAVRALERLGLAGQVAPRAVTIRRQQVSDQRDSPLFHVDTADLWRGVGACLALPRGELHQVLLAGAKDVPARWNCAPVAVVDTAEGVRVDFSDGTSGSYDLVVGADGVYSTVRRMLFDAAAVQRAGVYAYRFLAQWQNAPGVWSLRLNARSALLTIPVSSEQVYVYCDTPHTNPLPPLRDLLDEHGRLDLLDGADQAVHAAPIEEVELDRWSRGLAVLIGDAAHATAPNMAQGAAMAFEDAIVLADTLAEAHTVGGALRMYEHRRRPRTDWVLKQTRRRESFRRVAPRLRDRLYRRGGPKMFHAHHRLLRAEP